MLWRQALALKPIKTELTYHKNLHIYKLKFIIDERLTIQITGPKDDIKEINKDFQTFSPMEQRAHLNVILTERLSK